MFNVISLFLCVGMGVYFKQSLFNEFSLLCGRYNVYWTMSDVSLLHATENDIASLTEFITSIHGFCCNIIIVMNSVNIITSLIVVWLCLGNVDVSVLSYRCCVLTSKVFVILVSSVMGVVRRLSTAHAGGVLIATHRSTSAHRVTMATSTACGTDLYGLRCQKHKSEYHIVCDLFNFLLFSVASVHHNLLIKACYHY